MSTDPRTLEGGTAYLSEDRRHRFALARVWDVKLPKVTFVGLNPSTADEQALDPTLRRCVRYAMDWGYGCFWMANLFSYRATDPDDMKAQGPAANHPDNDAWILRMADWSQIVVCAWGTQGGHLGRDAEVLTMLKDWGYRDKLRCLRVTNDGHPNHPLYLPKRLSPIPFGVSCD